MTLPTLPENSSAMISARNFANRALNMCRRAALGGRGLTHEPTERSPKSRAGRVSLVLAAARSATTRRWTAESDRRLGHRSADPAGGARQGGSVSRRRLGPGGLAAASPRQQYARRLASPAQR